MRHLTLVRSFGGVGWGLIAFLAILIGVTSLRFLTFNPAVLTEELRPNLLQHPLFFYAHTTLAPLALLIGVWQFLPVTRRNSYHRWAGRLYVACAGLASVAGFIIAMTTEAGPLAGAGFMTLAVLWFSATAIAYARARSGDFAAHRIWMIRSYALTCAAISLRIILPVGSALGAGFANSYIAAAWASWIINLLIAEWIIRRIRFRKPMPLATSR